MNTAHAQKKRAKKGPGKVRHQCRGCPQVRFVPWPEFAAHRMRRREPPCPKCGDEMATALDLAREAGTTLR